MQTLSKIKISRDSTLKNIFSKRLLIYTARSEAMTMHDVPLNGALRTIKGVCAMAKRTRTDIVETQNKITTQKKNENFGVKVRG